MATLKARVPDIDWSKGFDRHWCGGSPTMTHWYNAISFMLPSGEKFFRDTARDVANSLDLSNNPKLKQEVREFAVQESLHAAQHQHFNAVLEAQGFKNVVDPSIIWWRNFGNRHLSPLTNLAAVCAYEHYTAILAEDLLRAPSKWMESAPDLALFWGWHAAEETEHKAVCFDLYVAAGGGWFRRVLIFLIVSIGFNFVFFMRSYLALLRADGLLNKNQLAGTVGSKPIRNSLLGPVSFALGSVIHYLSPTFHPWKRDNRAQMENWLRVNASRLKEVGRPAAATVEAA